MSEIFYIQNNFKRAPPTLTEIYSPHLNAPLNSIKTFKSTGLNLLFWAVIRTTEILENS